MGPTKWRFEAMVDVQFTSTSLEIISGTHQGPLESSEHLEMIERVPKSRDDVS